MKTTIEAAQAEVTRIEKLISQDRWTPNAGRHFAALRAALSALQDAYAAACFTR